MSTIKTIVAGVGSVREPDATVLPSAVKLADRTGAELYVVHAYQLADPMFEAYARMGYLDGVTIKSHEDELRAQLEAQVRRVTTSERVRCRVVATSPAGAIHHVASEVNADLVVVGAARSGTIAQTILGTTAQRVLRSSEVPVLVLRKPLSLPLGKVLMTTDLTEFSAGIHQRGMETLEPLVNPASLLRSLVVVWFPGVVPPPLPPTALTQVAETEIRRFLRDQADREKSGFQIEPRVREGDPAAEVVAEAADWEADLVVMGTHARRGSERFLLGSVAEATLRSALTNVLVIPPAPLPRVQIAQAAAERAAVPTG